MDGRDRDNCEDEAKTNEELANDCEDDAPTWLDTATFRVFSRGEFILRLVEGLLTSVAREFKRGAWLHLDVAALAEAVSRQVDGWGVQVSEADVQAAVRELDLAGSIRVREIDGLLCFRLSKRAWRRVG
jgi:hypothetical protein